MSLPPANIPEQPWTYPPAHSPARQQTSQPQLPMSDSVAVPIWEGVQTKSRGRQIALITLATIGVLVIIFFALVEAGLSGTLVGAIAALVPLAIVLATVHWLDRWEPEPRIYLFLSFAWGAGIATVAALLLNTRAFTLLSAVFIDPAAVELIGVGVVAPVTEELLKGGALLAIVLWRRRLINSTVDLLVYAATIASGFAFTENILYFARGTSDGVFGAVFFGRAVMSPFAHIMFTSATALVLATVVFSRRSHLWWAYPLGTTVAILLHAAWNITAVLAGSNFVTVFLWLHVPIFLAFVGIVLLLRRRERQAIVRNLHVYAAQGWFAPHEVNMLGSLAQRAVARSWAGDFGVRAGQTMAQFQIAATGLALNRQHMVHAARKDPQEVPTLVRQEHEHLQQIHRLRATFLGLTGVRGTGA